MILEPQKRVDFNAIVDIAQYYNDINLCGVCQIVYFCRVNLKYYGY